MRRKTKAYPLDPRGVKPGCPRMETAFAAVLLSRRTRSLIEPKLTRRRFPANSAAEFARGVYFIFRPEEVDGCARASNSDNRRVRLSFQRKPVETAAGVRWRKGCRRPAMTGIAFQKMHGLGNDFVVLDSRGRDRLATPSLAKALADRRRGVGFDQLAEIADSDVADARLEFLNADGSASAACGNATRCIARKLMDESGRSNLDLETERGILACLDAGGGQISVNMGRPMFDWRDIPLAEDIDSLSLPLKGSPCAVGLGNPHCVFFVDDCENVDLDAEGPKFETHRLFPEGANVEFATVVSRTMIRMRIWERGAGITLASGSGSCATAIAAARRGFAERKVSIRVDGGTLDIDWREDGVWMTGPTSHVFDAELSEAFLEAYS